MSRRIAQPSFAPGRQRGAATLITVLILLTVIALIGLASMRGTLMEEHMAASTRDRALSFQAAEAALREGELLAATKPALPASGCAKGLCAKPDPAAAPVWSPRATRLRAAPLPRP